MSHDLISYAKSSAEWLGGMEWHIKSGSAVWVTDRAKLAASELDNCVSEITRLRTALAEARKVIEPFSVMAGELFARNFNDPENVIVFHAADKTHVKLTFKDFRAARAWAEANKEAGE